ncbi:MAG TPA: hypothetical protein VFG83_18190 [Kofleriaceae bacterium]|nr:hypothetical protein [Kofleriaceae bacterium]
MLLNRPLLALAAAATVFGCGTSDGARPDAGRGPTADSSIPPVDGAPGTAADAPPGADAAPEVIPDPCEGQAPACPSPPGDLTEGGGLIAFDRCAVPLEERDEWQERAAVIDGFGASLSRVELAAVLGDLNRTAQPVSSVPGDPPAVAQAFAWNDGDEGVTYWTPQGITTSGAGTETGRVDGKRVVMVSWYYNIDNDPGSPGKKGVRIAVTDATDPDDVHYRFVLLVDPKMIDGHPSYAAVNVHAGGIAWVGHYLYVVHTGVGFRVFDLDGIYKVATGQDSMGYDPASGKYYAHNYAYILPQVDTVANVSSCSPRFSFVALDKTTTPASLITGEYDSASINGRLYRWPLDPDNQRLQVVGDGRVIAGGAWFSGQSHLQGALAHDGQMWLSSSKPAGSAGVLYRTAEGTATQSYGWNDSPEDLSFDPVDQTLWSLSEGKNARYVFSVPLASVD